MLQQTRVEAVVPYYERFMRELPTVSALAEATADRVMSLWSGLGYYRRARMLHEAAQQIAGEGGGAFPETAAGLLEVRGIGRYTAGAIASIAYGERAALVDGNVARVLARLFAIEEDVRAGAGLRRVWALAEALVPEARAGDWNEALMELGATTCIPRAPRCMACPLEASCEARARGIEARLPELAAKKKPVLTRQVALVATMRRKVVLARRRPGGLFGRLWEPPTLALTASHEEARAAFGALLGVRVPAVKVAGLVTHTLSHRALETRVLVARLSRVPRPVFPPDSAYDALELVDEDAFAGLGMSTFARKLLGQAGVLSPRARRI